MDERERHQQGDAMRRRVLSDAHVDRSKSRATPLTEEFQDLITRYAWGEIWTRPGLDTRTRRLVVIGTLVALGRFDELRLHVTAALRDGLPAEDIKEVLLQQAVYCGVPAANSAFEVFRDVMDTDVGR